MAAITPSVTPVEGDLYARGVVLVQWVGIGDSDTCVAAQVLDFADRSVQIAGTFGAATIKLQGSNDGTNYADLTDPQGNAISKTTAAIEAVMELTRYMKPVTSGGTGSAITVTVLARKGS